MEIEELKEGLGFLEEAAEKEKAVLTEWRKEMIERVKVLEKSKNEIEKEISGLMEPDLSIAQVEGLQERVTKIIKKCIQISDRPARSAFGGVGGDETISQLRDTLLNIKYQISNIKMQNNEQGSIIQEYEDKISGLSAQLDISNRALEESQRRNADINKLEGIVSELAQREKSAEEKMEKGIDQIANALASATSQKVAISSKVGTEAIEIQEADLQNLFKEVLESNIGKVKIAERKAGKVEEDLARLKSLRGGS